MARVQLVAACFLLAFVSAAFAQQCAYECQGVGEECKWSDCGSDANPCLVCTPASFCEDGYCRSPAKIGGSCDNADPKKPFCGSDFVPYSDSCDDNVCYASGSPFGPGEKCDTEYVDDDSCYIGNCGEDGECPSVATGANCTGEGEYCELGSFCNDDGVCEAFRAAGSACTSNSQCRYDARCVDDKCLAYGSLSEGDACPGTSYCKTGLYCDDDSEKCTKPDTSLVGKKCTNDSQCVSEKDTPYVCWHDEAGCIESTCQLAVSIRSKDDEAQTAYYKCVADNKCAGVGEGRFVRAPYVSPDSKNCAAKNCASAYAKVLRIENRNACSSAAIALPALALLLALIAMLSL